MAKFDIDPMLFKFFLKQYVGNPPHVDSHIYNFFIFSVLFILSRAIYVEQSPICNFLIFLVGIFLFKQYVGQSSQSTPDVGSHA